MGRVGTNPVGSNISLIALTYIAGEQATGGSTFLNTFLVSSNIPIKAITDHVRALKALGKSLIFNLVTEGTVTPPLLQSFSE